MHNKGAPTKHLHLCELSRRGHQIISDIYYDQVI